ncbi:MAG: hypothetical protein Q8O66_00255, partial [bacterium]|nr:hypothetical protein [bacterium]
ISAFLTVVSVIAVCCFMIAGILFTIARGDPQKISQSKGALIGGVVGAVVVIISSSILPILLGWLG